MSFVSSILPGVVGGDTDAALSPLFNLNNLSSTRSSPAADCNPLNGWAFNVITGWNDGGQSGPGSSIASSTTLADWTDINTPGETTGVSDPFGGTNAFTTEDNDSIHDEGHSYTISSAVKSGLRYRYRIWIKKENLTDVAELILECGSGTPDSVTFHIDPDSGQYDVTTVGMYQPTTTVETAPENSGWWRLTCEFTAAKGGSAVFYVYPGNGDVQVTYKSYYPNPTTPTSTQTFTNTYNATQGTLTWYPPVLEEQASFVPENTPRIMAIPDTGLEAVLCEKQRANYMPYGGFFDQTGWVQSNVTVTQDHADQCGVAEHGYTVEDSSTSAIGSVSDNGTSAVSTLGATVMVLSVYVLKDADTSRFPEFQVNEGSSTFAGGDIAVQLNTATGATNTRTGTPTFVDVYEGDNGTDTWWRLCIGVNITSNLGVGIAIRPAATASLGSTNVATTGSIVLGGLMLEEGEFVSSFMPSFDVNGSQSRSQDNGMDVPNADIPASFWTDGFTFDYYPLYASAENPDDCRLYFPDTNDQVFETRSGGESFPRLRIGGTWYGGAIDVSSHTVIDRMTHVCDFAGTQYEILINEVSAGTDTTSGTWSSVSANDLTLGNDGSSSRASFGLITVAYE